MRKFEQRYDRDEIRVEMDNFDDLFMNMAYLIAMKSKDSSTHVGAVIIGPDNEVRSTGYNSFVRNLNDDVKERNERPEKYYWLEHAERNAIYNASLIGVSLKGCRLYTNGMPCCDCARAVIQSGIKEVIIDKYWDDPDESNRWSEEALRSKEMFFETGVTIREWSGDLIQIHKYKRDLVIP